MDTPEKQKKRPRRQKNPDGWIPKTNECLLKMVVSEDLSSLKMFWFVSRPKEVGYQELMQGVPWDSNILQLGFEQLDPNFLSGHPQIQVASLHF